MNHKAYLYNGIEFYLNSFAFSKKKEIRRTIKFLSVLGASLVLFGLLNLLYSWPTGLISLIIGLISFGGAVIMYKKVMDDFYVWLGQFPITFLMGEIIPALEKEKDQGSVFVLNRYIKEVNRLN